MLVKVYPVIEAEAREALEQAQAASMTHMGSHDDTQLTVVVNGRELATGSNTWQWVSVQRNEYEPEEREPEAPFADFGDVWSFSILDTYAHYGSSQRSRATLSVYYRSLNSPGHFIVIDAGEVGGKDSGKAPFRTHDLFEVLTNARNKTRVQVGGDAETWKPIMGFWNGRYMQYRPFKPYNGERLPWAMFDFEFLEPFFGKYVDNQAPEFSMEALQRMLVKAFIDWIKSVGKLREDVFEVAVAFRSKYNVKLDEFYKELWPQTLLGSLFSFFASPLKEDNLRWRGQWEKREVEWIGSKPVESWVQVE